jgi:hypothetical protein
MMSWDVTVVSDVCPFVSDDDITCDLDDGVKRECAEDNCPIKVVPKGGY